MQETLFKTKLFDKCSSGMHFCYRLFAFACKYRAVRSGCGRGGARGCECTPPQAGQIISKSCSFSPENEFTLLNLASKINFLKIRTTFVKTLIFAPTPFSNVCVRDWNVAPIQFLDGSLLIFLLYCCCYLFLRFKNRIWIFFSSFIDR